MSKNKNNEAEVNEDAKICEKCGSVLTTEEGFEFCPHCDGEINFLGEDDE